jgi:hypothetical protein
MPLQQTSGNDTQDAYGGGAAAIFNYIEDVFSTWLYTGNGSTQTITNGIDLAGKGGLVWVKGRNVALSHALIDTVNGVDRVLQSDTSRFMPTYSGSVFQSFNSNGFTMQPPSSYGDINDLTPYNYVSWTFRKQAKFFDVVTYTGDSNFNTSGAVRSVPHSLTSTPGLVIIKAINSGTENWIVAARLSDTQWTRGNGFALNRTDASDGAFNYSSTTYATSSVFYPAVIGGGYLYSGNDSGTTYVAYLFAHNAGGFGAAGTDNVITCGSVDGATTQVVNLGYEPQWLLLKNYQYVGRWKLLDTMRGFTTTGSARRLWAERSEAEDSTTGDVSLSTTGFNLQNNYPGNLIYMAIRRA